MIPADIERFICELRADPVSAPEVDRLVEALCAVDLEADYNTHATAFFGAVEWIIAQPRPAREKFEMIGRLARLKGRVSIPSMREFTGWSSP